MRKILAIVMVAAMFAALAVTASAANTDGLVGFYKFEGNFDNEVEGGAAGEAVGNKFGAPAGDAAFADGKFQTVNGTNDGAKFALGLEGDFTVSFYVSTEASLASPLVWVGGTNQGPENWIGVWWDPGADWNMDDAKITMSSNDPDNNRITVNPSAALTNPTDAYITITVADGVGSIYVNGKLAGATNTDGAHHAWAGGEADTETNMPNPWEAEDCAIYFGVNAWDASANASYDNLAVYSRALSADEVSALYAAGGDPTAEGEAQAPQTGFATIALAVVALGSGAYVVSKKH